MVRDKEYVVRNGGPKFLCPYTFTKYPSRELGALLKAEELKDVIIPLKELTLELWR